MREVVSLSFQDAGSGDDAWAGLRASHGCIALTLSLRHDGDIMVSLPVYAARAIVAGLNQAIVIAEMDSKPNAATDGEGM